MKLIIPVFFFIVSSTISTAQVPKTDFFYLIFQWPGSKCNSKEGCCYNGKAKLARNFHISHLKPYYFNGTSPTYCKSNSSFDLSKINDLEPTMRIYWAALDCPATESEKLWSNEWLKHGTCTETILDQHQYFAAALKLKKIANLLQVLNDGGVYPNGTSYDVGKISDAIVAAGLHLPGLVCNRDKDGNFQLNKIILCSNYNGAYFVECPGNIGRRCSKTAKFPTFNF